MPSALQFMGFALALVSLFSSPAFALGEKGKVQILKSSLQASDRLSDPDVIFDPSVNETALPEWVFSLNQGLAEILTTFFKGLVPDPIGQERFQVLENPIDQFVTRIGDSNFQTLLQGVGNLKALGGPYMYNEFQGGIGVEYDFVRPDDANHSTVIAVRISPLYGEIALVRMAAGANDVQSLPTRAFMGSSAGLEISRKFGIFQPGIRAYARPEMDLGSRASGVSLYQALYCRILLKNFKAGRDSAGVPSFYLTPTLTYYDRGAQKEALYAWNRDHANASLRNVDHLRRFWEATVSLELRY